ncbi:squalene/phytoene synthase family protein [candidate division WOR-3 bacterium]|nr:squalene/phytoene synthase family protein [candidate division WOR-3 bacterium]
MFYDKDSLKKNNFEAYLAVKLFIRGERGRLANFLYAYLRWIDDYIDNIKIDKSEQKSFLQEQSKMINCLYDGNKFETKNYFEKAISGLIEYDIKNDFRLKTVLQKMFEVFNFDINRKKSIPHFEELNDYSKKIGDAYTRALLFFLAPSLPYKEKFSLSAYASHQAHLLRDFTIDKENHYFNISREEITRFNIKKDLTMDKNFSNWVKEKVDNIKSLFEKGKKQIKRIPILQVRLTGYLYCSRYEKVITRIEKNGYKLT